MTAYDPARTPEASFDAYLAAAERDPEFRTRQERIARLQARSPLHPLWSRLFAAISAMTLAALLGSVALWSLAWLPRSD